MLPATFPAFHPTKRMVPAADVVAAFNASQPRYRASIAGRAIVIRPVDSALTFLDRPSTLGASNVTGVMAAARRVFSVIEPGLLGPIAGSGSLIAEDVPLTLDGRGRTVLDTLNQIVTQAPGRTWIVTTRTEGTSVRATSVGFVRGDAGRDRQGLTGTR